MNLLITTLAAVAVSGALAAGGFAQSAIDNEPPPRLIVEPPLPGPLARGVVFIPYWVENLRSLPVGGPAARNVSPRVGHLHITVDALPWQWADYGQSNTVVLVGMPGGEHKVLIEVVDAEGNVFYGAMMGTGPQTIGYGLTDSPVGLAAWLLGHPGGHFAAWEQPELFSAELRAAFRSLR